MKVIMINGSPNKKGCTYTALEEVGNELARHGIESEIRHIGNKPVMGCQACNVCWKTGACVFKDDPANEIREAIKAADGLVVGSPVYYGGPNGTLCALLDRIFYPSRGSFAFKPAAAVVSCRRGGNTASFDRLNKYFTISNMPVVSSQYWNMVLGFTPEDVRKDLEGLQTMRTLAQNMAWMLKCFAEGKESVGLPRHEEKIYTHFIE
ncbi:MAG: flavodoxin family protein [Desulfovibrionaceae bacterium]|nr:flavodoxin family protein [Desulfovibrionaceae bacterium]